MTRWGILRGLKAILKAILKFQDLKITITEIKDGLLADQKYIKDEMLLRDQRMASTEEN